MFVVYSAPPTGLH